MNDDEIVKIDKEELENQRLEEMLKGEYMEVRIVVPDIGIEDGKTGVVPYMHVKRHGTGPMSSFIMIEALKSMEEDIEKRDPMIGIARAFFDTRTQHIDSIESKKEAKSDE